MDVLTNLIVVVISHYIYIYQFIKLYIVNLHTFLCGCTAWHEGF